MAIQGEAARVGAVVAQPSQQVPRGLLVVLVAHMVAVVVVVDAVTIRASAVLVALEVQGQFIFTPTKWRSAN